MHRALLLFGLSFFFPNLQAQNPSDKALHAIYNFRFNTADSIIRKHLTEDKDAAKHLLSTYYYWWLIISGEDNSNFRKDYNSEIQKAIKLLDLKKSEINNQDIEQYILAYALKVRIELLNYQVLSGLVHLNNCIGYIKKSFNKEKEHEMFYLTSGLYNYFSARSQKDYPFLTPYLIFYPKGNIEIGINQLLSAYRSENTFLKTESAYFLMKIYLEQEKKYDRANFFSKYLLNQYPDNLLFRYYHFLILLNLDKLPEALKEAEVIKVAGDKNPQLTQKQKEHFVQLIKANLEKYEKEAIKRNKI
jgi:hypothetical protein